MEFYAFSPPVCTAPTPALQDAFESNSYYNGSLRHPLEEGRRMPMLKRVESETVVLHSMYALFILTLSKILHASRVWRPG